MKRRNFIKTASIGLGLVGFAPSVMATTSSKSKVLVVKAGNLTEAFDRAIKEFGGMENYISNREKVILKPDMSINVTPDKKLTTNPELVAHIVKSCYELKSRGVFVFDHCKDEWTKCYKNSGIERLAKDANAKVFPGNHPLFFYEVENKNAITLKKLQLHKQFQNYNYLFNIPVFKPDSETTIASGVKNLMGCVLNWEDYYKNRLHRCLAEFLYLKQPDLTIIDASNIADNCLIASTDVVAADAVACRMAGIDPSKVQHLKIASDLKLGNIAEEKIEVIKKS